MAGAATRDGVVALLNSLAAAPTPTTWDSWLPLAGLAMADPQDWVVAFQTLRTEEQYQVLELLRREDAGPFADALLTITARYASEIEDSQVRDYLLTDAMAASERRVELMAEQRDRLVQLAGEMEHRQSAEFDLAEEMGRVERTLSGLRLAEIDTEYERVHAGEREILRLERFASTLRAYDAEARDSHRQDLVRETESLGQRRHLLEQEIAKAIAERDVSLRAAEAAAFQLAEIQAESEQLLASSAESSGSIAAMTASVNELRRTGVEQSQQLADLERQHRELSQRIEEDARRVRELRENPAARGMQELLEALERVWPLLPPDEVESQFRH